MGKHCPRRKIEACGLTFDALAVGEPDGLHLALTVKRRAVNLVEAVPRLVGAKEDVYLSHYVSLALCLRHVPPRLRRLVPQVALLSARVDRVRDLLPSTLVRKFIVGQYAEPGHKRDVVPTCAPVEHVLLDT